MEKLPGGVRGRQDLSDPARLVYGQSITDACLSWEIDGAGAAGARGGGARPAEPCRAKSTSRVYLI